MTVLPPPANYFSKVSRQDQVNSYLLESEKRYHSLLMQRDIRQQPPGK